MQCSYSNWIPSCIFLCPLSLSSIPVSCLPYFISFHSKCPCIIALDNGRSKAPIRRSWRGRSCLAHVKHAIFEVRMTENFLAYSVQFIFLIIRLAPWNVVMVAIDMCGKSPITREWVYGITWKHVLPFMFFVYLFIYLSV